MNKQRKFFEYLTIGLFAIILFGGCLLAQIPSLRPTYSEEEKRTLAEFPTYSAEALADGSYFSGISLWFSDTFPFREQLVALNASVESLHGKSAIQISGNVVEGDEIPDGETDMTVDAELTEEPATEEDGFRDDDGIDENYTEPEDPGAVQKFGAVLQVGDTAYEYYGFSESSAHAYAAVLNDAATLLGDDVQVYTMVVPNSMGVMLPDSLRSSIKTGDQEKAIDFIYAQMSEQVQTVPIYAALRAHRSEYIYFRTDHHWTALGAYYAYTKLASLNEWELNDLSRYETVSYGPFLGSFYSHTGKSAALAANPDELIAYKPFYESSFTYWDRSGVSHKASVITDVSTWSKSSKYSAFISGDQPYSEIHNTSLSDGSACVVLKESYGNAFVPFLASHYEHTYVVDYRYWKGKLPTLVTEKAISDVYFVNNIMAAQTKERINNMRNLLS